MDETDKLLLNAARFVSRTGLVKYTRFLDPSQAASAAALARQEGVFFSSYGGYDRAERQIGCFHAEPVRPDEQEYPLVCLGSRFPSRFSSISHRDLLGAFMSLGLTRDCVGDIIIVEDNVYLFASDSTASYIASGLTSAGRTPLQFSVLTQAPVIPEPEGEQFSAVISSMRLDAVLAAAYKLSRNESAEVIRAGLVKLDHIPCERIDAQVSEGALLSLRGRGRIRLQSVNGLTRKQRIGVTFFRFG